MQVKVFKGKIMFKKIVAVIAVIVFVAGVAFQVISKVGDSDKNNAELDVFDPNSFCAGAVGRVHVMPDDLGGIDDDTSFCIIYDDVGDMRIIPLEGKFDMTRYLLETDGDGNAILNLTVSECPDERRQKVIDAFNDQNQMTYEYLLENDGDPESIELFEYYCSDEFKALFEECVPHYQGKVTGVADHFLSSVGLWMSLIGGVIAAFTLLSFKFSVKSILLGTVALILVAAVGTLFFFRKRISTFASVKQYVPGVYQMRCSADYKLDDLLASDVSSLPEFADWASDELFFGMPIDIAQGSFGCSSFSVMSPEGHHLMGRNYDFPETDTMMIYSTPKDGYASIGLVDIGLLGLGTDEGELDPESKACRLISVLLPYMTVDGMNEAGVGVSILMLESGEIHQDNGKPDILMNIAIRAILDTCGSTDEAIALLDSYDMHSMIGSEFHLFISDKSGKSVTVEWLDNDTVVTEGPAVTNHVLGDPVYHPINPYGESTERYNILMDDLACCSGTTSPEDAMTFLADVSWDSVSPYRNQTEWSCVYDLDSFEVYICFDVDYDHIYTITPETF